MLSQEFMRNALLAGTPIALACGLGGWFLVLRGQVFAGDALSHVAFPGALAAAAVGVDARVGLVLATVIAGASIGLLGRGLLTGVGPRAGSATPADDTTIAIVFTFILGLGLFFLTRVSLGGGGASGIEAAHALFGSIFGLGRGEAGLLALWRSRSCWRYPRSRGRCCSRRSRRRRRVRAEYPRGCSASGS